MIIYEKFSESKINITLVTDLIKEQFSEWTYLPIKSVDAQGHDNRTFRLGEKMLIRLPSAQRYALKVEKEQQWLPLLAPHLSFTIPKPLAMGKPSKNYPFNWSVYQWIEGKSANLQDFKNLNLELIASDLAQFLKELHKIDRMGGFLKPGAHNFYRGDSPVVYDAETRTAIVKLQNFIDVEKALSVWEKAISSKWKKDSVWVHGDFAAGNILIKDNRLTAVIDFGGMCVGDPACDLVIAWTFLNNENRKIFKSSLGLDANTWARARGWALWKALITIAPLKDKTSLEFIKNKKIIDDIIYEHELEN